MIKGENKILQAFIATVITWLANAAGAALVFVFYKCNCLGNAKVLDFSLGFAAGVMTAASFWSLLAPGIDLAETSKIYGGNGQFAFAPVAIGLALGGIFVILCDLCIPHISGKNPSIAFAVENEKEDKSKSTGDEKEEILDSKTESIELVVEISNESDEKEKAEKYKSWKRILLLIIAMTVHNIPEGMAVGVGFGAIGTTTAATYESARNLAIGMCLQNMPEGMAVSIPLCAAGYTPLKSFWYGQLSGLVEPIFGVLGALIVVVAVPLLPYALSFAAGAMLYVVFDDIIPEANQKGNGRYATWGCMIGFIVMMCLDVGLGKI